MRSVTVLSAALLLLACAADRPEVKIRKAFAAAAKAVEAGDAGGAAEILDEGFQGPEGMNKAEARLFLLGWLRREQLGVTVLAQQIEVRGDQAVQVAELLLTARSGSALLPRESSRRTLQLRWRRAGQAWKVVEIRTDGA
jgi:ketosteroid isomerase-like protein